MAEQPRIRASIAQDQLTYLKQEPEWPEIAEAFGPALIETVESASRIGWLAGEVNFTMAEGVHDHLGLERGQQFFYDRFEAAWDTAIFRSIVRGSMRLLGADPGGLLAMIPKGHPLAFRGFGVYEVAERTAQSLTLRQTGIPERCFSRDAAWIRFAAFSQLSVIALADTQGTVEVSVDKIRREAAHHFKW